MATKGFRPGVGNVATWNEGKLKRKVQLYTEGGLINDLFIKGQFSSSYTEDNHFAGNIFVEGNLHISGTTTFGDAAVDLTKHTGKISSSYAGTNNFEGSVLVEDVVKVSGSITTAADLSVGDDLSLTSDSAIINMGAGNDVTLTHDGGTGLDLTSAGNLDIESTAGSITLGASLADGQTLKLGKNSAVETIIAPHGTAGSEKYSVINTAGTTDGFDAGGSILLSAVAGGIGLAWADDKDLWAEGGQFIVTANHDVANAIKLHADAGTSQTITLINDAGTTDGSSSTGAILLGSSAGGIGLIWADGKDLWAEGGRAVITANEDAAGCIKLHADAGTSQTILIQNDAGTAAGAVNIAADAGGITLDAGLDIVLDADGDQISMKFGGATGQIDFSNTNSGDGIIRQMIDGKDLIIQQYDGTEVVRFTDAGKVEIAKNLTIGTDVDGTDRSITFGHNALKSIVGIDDDQDRFVINTDGAFEATNDLEISNVGDVLLGNGNLSVNTVATNAAASITLGADSDDFDRSIVFGHSTLKSIIGVDDDSDVFAINTDGSFETTNDLEIDANGNVNIYNGTLTIAGTAPKLVIGDGGGEDTLLVFDGATVDYRMGIDDGTDSLQIGIGDAHGTTSVLEMSGSGKTQIRKQFGVNTGGGVGTFSSSDTTPSVADGNLWKTHASTQTLTDFDDGVIGQTITVVSTAAVTYDVSETTAGTGLKGGSTNIVTADNDVTVWTYDGSNWHLVQFLDFTIDNSTGGAIRTFSESDGTPSVTAGNLFQTHTTGVTVTDFDNGRAGQTITVVSKGAIVYDVTSSGLKGGSTNITTAAGDITTWTYDGTDWYLVQFMDVSADMSSVSGGGGGSARSVAGDTDNGIISWVTSDNTFAAEANLTFDGSTLTVTGDAVVTDDLTLNSDSAVFNMGAGNDFTITHDGTTGATLAGTPISINSTGDLTLDSTTDIVIDPAGGNVEFKDAGTLQLTLDMDGTVGAQVIKLGVDGDDLVFQQYDGTEVLKIDDNTSVVVATDLTVGDDLSLISDSAVFNMGVGNDFTITHDGTTGATLAGTPISINSTGDLTLDSSTDIVFDAAGGNFEFKDGGTLQLTIDVDTSGGDIDINLGVNGDDLVFNQYDGTEVLRLTDGGDVEVKDDLTLKSDSAVFGMGAGSDFTITHDGTTGATLAGTPISINSSGDLTLDSSTDIVIDAAGGNVEFKDNGTLQLTLDMDGVGDGPVINLEVDGDDLIFKQYDGNEVIRIADDRKLYFYDMGGEHISSDGSTLTVAGGEIVLDSAADIVIDAAGGNVEFKDAGTLQLTIDMDGSTGDIDVNLGVDGDDLVFNQYDGTEVLRLTDGGDVEVKDDLTLKSDSAVLALGAGSDVTLTHDGGTGLDFTSAGNLDIDCTAGSITLGASLTDGQTLKLGKNGAVETIIAPHGTAGSEKYTVTNTAGTAADAIGLTATAGGITLTTAAAGVVIAGTTPKLTIGDAGTEDTMLAFDGNAQDYHMALVDAADNLVIGVGTTAGTTSAISINSSAQVQIVDAFAANTAGTFGTFADGDATPSVATGNLWKHHASTQTITMFDDGTAGQTIHVISTAAITYDVTSTNLKGGSTNIVTASGDITSWFFDGTNWYLVQFMDVSADMSSVGGGGGGGDGAVSALNNATENELVTVGSTTTELDAETNLTWDGAMLTIGADSDGTDHVIHFGHSTNKTIIGIDDSLDVFAIKCDDTGLDGTNAFEINTDNEVFIQNSLVVGNNAKDWASEYGAINTLIVSGRGNDQDNGIMIVRDDNTSTNADNILGGIGFDSTDGQVPSTPLEASCYIAGFAAEAHGSSDKGGYMTFGTAEINDDDDTTSHERMKIDSDGHITITSETPNATGNGANGSGGSGIAVYVGKVNGEIVTTILIDLTDFADSGTVGDVIGENGIGAAYLTQITTAVNGVIYRAEMSCIEIPAGTNCALDIDLNGNSNSLAEDASLMSAGTTTTMIQAGADWDAGTSRWSASGTDLVGLVDDYVYLSNGTGANSGGTYTGGKFVIKLYGANF